MPDLSWNKAMWDGRYNWIDLGEEWSESWGGSEAQWFGSLYPRLHRFLPAENILEIAPGFGRWTYYLLRYLSGGHYTGIDLSESCVEHCKKRFSGLNAVFHVNDGLTLDAAEENSYGFVFSFDSLVHANFDVHQSYIPQILNKLSANGVAFIHHSNWAGSGCANPNSHGRAEDVSAQAYAELVGREGGHVILQECLNWGSEEKEIDAFTLFCRGDRDRLTTVPVIHNPNFYLEATLIRNSQNIYSSVF